MENGLQPRLWSICFLTGQRYRIIKIIEAEDHFSKGAYSSKFESGRYF